MRGMRVRCLGDVMWCKGQVVKEVDTGCTGVFRVHTMRWDGVWV